MLDLKEESSPTWGDYPDWAWEKPSLAVIACRDGYGTVVWHAGPHLASELEVVGVLEIGNDYPEDGVFIWEGVFRVFRTPSSPNGPEEYDSEEVSKVRKPTEEEWKAIRENRCPWSEEEWGLMLPKSTHELARALLEGPDLPAVVDGYEDGVTEILAIAERRLERDVNREAYNGSHKAVDEPGGERCVLLSRHRLQELNPPKVEKDG